MINIHPNKIRIRIKAYNNNLLTVSCEKILDTARKNNSRVVGPIYLPTKRKVYCVLTSPHVNKDSREHFEIRKHRRIIDIYHPSVNTINGLMKLDIPAGVDIEVKL
eukprot:jgi/Galph1/4617/GphlegSOOS_G3257.1